MQVCNKGKGNEAKMEELFSLNSEFDKDKKLVIFGTGLHAKETYAQLIHYGIKPDYFADKNPNLKGVRLFGIEILQEEELENMDCQIVIASTAWQIIEERLNKMGKTDIWVDTSRYCQSYIDV